MTTRIALGLETPIFLLLDVSIKKTQNDPQVGRARAQLPWPSELVRAPVLAPQSAPSRPEPHSGTEERAGRGTGADGGHAHAQRVLCLVHVRLSMGACGRCSPELQVTPGKLEAAGSDRPLPFTQQDAAGMPGAGHHYCDPDPGPSAPRLCAGCHSRVARGRGRK